jgi:outer membrane autotransporter protein
MRLLGGKIMGGVLAKSLCTLAMVAVLAPPGVWAQTPVQVNQSFNIEGPSPSNSPTVASIAAGAVESIVADPLHASTFYIGTVGGGVWSTTNNGVTWTPLTDKQATLSIASLDLDPTDPNRKTLIAGTGLTSNGFPGTASAQQNYLNRGGIQNGLLYSSDGGTTWSSLGGGANGALSGQTVVGVAARGQTILAATFQIANGPDPRAGGLYISNNGGSTFNLVSSLPGSGLPPGPVTSLVGDPNNPKKLYAAVTSANAAGNASTAIYMSPDSGATWSKVFDSTNSNNTITAGSQTVLRLTAGPNGTVAVGVIDLSTSKTTGLFWSNSPSTQAGSWKTLPVPNLNPGSQAPVNFAIAIDPTNSNLVYVTGDRVANGITASAFRIDTSSAVPQAQTITGTAGTANNTSAHADSRAIAFNAAGALILANDGGLYLRTSPQNSNGDWQSFSGNLSAFQPYAVGYDSVSRRLVVAAQDNYAALQSAPGSEVWTALDSGDGINAVVNDKTLATGPAANRRSAFYETSQNLGGTGAGDGPLRFIIDPNGNTTQATITCSVAGGPVGVCGSVVSGADFGSPFVLNKWSPPAQGSRIAMGGDHVYVGTDTLAGAQGPNVNQLNLDLTDVGATDGTVTAIAYGTRNNSNILIAGVSPSAGGAGQIWMTRDVTGQAVTVLPGYTAMNAFAPNSLVFDPRSSAAGAQERFYAADTRRLFGTNDGGASFTDLTSKLPTSIIRPTSVEFISNNGVNALLVGGLNNVANAQSPIAVADSDTGGNLLNWRPFGQNLPNSQISALSYNPAVDVLAVGTYGRGVAALYDVTSYFAQASVLQFGLADNNSLPDASYLTNGTNLDGTGFVRPLNKYGLGTLTIAGDASYTGGTTIFGGNMVLGTGGATGSVIGNVAFCNDAANPLCDSSNNKVLFFNRSNTYAFGGVISGPGQVVQMGNGVTDLTAANTYTGPTFVNAGALAVDGSISSPVFVNGGTLGGAGIVGSTVIATGAALQPGAFSNVGGTAIQLFGAPQPGYVGVGTLTVAGDLQFSPGSFYLPTTNSSTNVSGTATLAGTVMPLFLPGRVNKTSTIVLAGQPLTTSFDALALPASLSGTLGYTSNDVILNLRSQMATVPGLTPNEGAVGAGLDNAFNNNGGLPAFGSLYSLSPAGLAFALNQLSGQSLASEQTVLTSEAVYSREGILARLRQATYATAGGAQAALAYAGPDAISLDSGIEPGDPLAYAAAKKNAAATAFPLKAPAAPVEMPSTGITFWAQGMGGWGKINGNSNVAGTTGNFAGVLSGADMRLANNWLVGFALGYSGSSTNVSAPASSAQVDTGLVAGYAGTSFGAWNLRLGGTYGINSVATMRQIAFPGFMDRDTARFNAGTGQLFGELGYGAAIQSVAVEPFAGLAFVHLDTAGFTESGGASALSASGASQDTGYSTLGARAATAYTLWNGMVLIPRASVAWQYAFGEINPTTALAFAGIPGSNFNITGVPTARNAALIDAGADLRINPQAKLGLYYWGEHASTAHENGLRGTLSWLF